MIECMEIDKIEKKYPFFEYLFLLLKILVIVYYSVQYYYKNLV